MLFFLATPAASWALGSESAGVLTTGPPGNSLLNAFRGTLTRLEGGMVVPMSKVEASQIVRNLISEIEAS